MQSDLSRTVSLVTGSARGIGLAIADRLARNGSTVVYSDIDEEQLATTVAARDGAASQVLDVSEAGQVQRKRDDTILTPLLKRTGVRSGNQD